MSDLRTALGFRSLDASNLSIFENVKKETGGHDMKVLPLLNEVDMTVTHATFQKHFKFALKASVAPRDETNTFRTMMMCLIEFCDIPKEFFLNGGQIVKCGLIVFPNNEYDSSIRLWTSKQIGNTVIYEVTVSSYKDAVPQPMEEKPSQWKKMIIKD
jgi:hypothetical protein